MTSLITDDSDDTLLSLSFNQDGGCLAIGTAKGFRICNVSPFQETHRRTFAAAAQCRKSASDLSASDAVNEGIDSSSHRGGGVGKIEMLFRCNLYALVGGGTYPQYPPNRCIIWDDHCGRDAGYLIFRQRVLTVRLRRDRICIALRDTVYVYNFANLGEVLDTITTGENLRGLLCISTEALDNSSSLTSGSSDDGMILACPSVKRGEVRVELYGHRKTVLIDAHDSPLAAIALTVDGSLLVTASERGTLIRLFDTGKNASDKESSGSPSGIPLREFRRGIEQAKIGCLCFSMDKHWLGCTSDRGTVHVFRVKEEEEEGNTGDKSRESSRRGGEGGAATSTVSKFARSFLPRVLTKSSKTFILEGEHSYARVRGISHPQTCAFVPDKHNTIAVAGLDDYGNGCLLLAGFGSEDENGEDNSQKKLRKTKSSARRVAYHRFYKNNTSIDGKKEDWDMGKGGRSGSDEVLYIGEIDDNIDDIYGKTSEITIVDNDADGFVSVCHDEPKKVSEVSSSDLDPNEMNNQEAHNVCDDEI